MHVSRSLRDERGAVMVMAAVLIPVLLVLTALIVDGGTWFTHKRQLQNRADAGALAAGVQYQADWASCSAAPQTKLDAANRIDAAARDYAGDPAPHAYPNLPPGFGTLHNTEITEQNRLNVEINSDPSVAPGGHVDPDTSWNDPAGTGLGPCDPHPVADTFSAKDAYYVDVGVRERDQKSLFGMFGLDLFRNEAHARVELLSAAAGKGFLPIALPDQKIEQAELRYYEECSSGPVLLATVPLNPLDSTYQTTETTFWGKTVNDLPAGVPGGGIPTGIQLSFPDATACAGDDYIPISTEVRLAGVKSNVIDIDAMTCAQLVAAQFADCFSRVSNIRDFKDTNKKDPWIQEVTLQGGTCAPDALFARLDDASSCTFGVSVSIDWNDFATGRTGKDFTVSVGGDKLDPPNGANGSPNGVWTSSGLSNNDVAGRSDLTLSWSCTGCGKTGSPQLQSLFLGNATNAGVLSIVRTSETAPAPGGTLGAALQWFRAGTTATLKTVYPTVGLDSSFYVGQKRVLRLPKCKTGNNDTNDCNLDSGSPTNSQSIDCEPASGGQGHDFDMFRTGCDPLYDNNPLDVTAGSPWWLGPAPGHCPVGKNGILALDQPYRCVVKAPGFSPGVIADGIAAAIGNCPPANIQNNSCNGYDCINPNYYDPAQKAWSQPTNGDSPRVVYIFIVPYGSYKNTGSQDTIPVLDFAAFYVTGWHPQGNGNGQQNPCMSGPLPPGARYDDPVTSGGVVGYFVRKAAPDFPGNPDDVCTIGQIRPCTPVLVR